jgi:hypothetical protein
VSSRSHQHSAHPTLHWPIFFGSISTIRGRTAVEITTDARKCLSHQPLRAIVRTRGFTFV